MPINWIHVHAEGAAGYVPGVYVHARELATWLLELGAELDETVLSRIVTDELERLVTHAETSRAA